MPDTADTSDQTDQVPPPVWNLEDDTKPAFVMDLHEWLSYENHSFDNLVKNYTMIMKDKIIVSSAEHAVKLNLGTLGVPGTYEKPHEPEPGSTSALSDTLKSRFTVMPELLANLDNELFKSL